MNISIPALDRNKSKEFSTLDSLFKSNSKNSPKSDFLSFQKKYDNEYSKEDKKLQPYNHHREKTETNWNRKDDRRDIKQDEKPYESNDIKRDVPKKESKKVDAPQKKLKKQVKEQPNEEETPEVVAEDNNSVEEVTEAPKDNSTTENNEPPIEETKTGDIPKEIVAELKNIDELTNSLLEQTAVENKIDHTLTEVAHKEVTLDVSEQSTKKASIESMNSIQIPDELTTQLEEKIQAAKQHIATPLGKEKLPELLLENKTLDEVKEGNILKTGEIKITTIETPKKSDTPLSQNLLEQLAAKNPHINSGRSQQQTSENNNENNEQFTQDSFLSQLNKSTKNIVNKIKQVAFKNLEQKQQALNELSSESQKITTPQKMTAAPQTGMATRLNTIQGIQEIITRMQGALKGSSIGKQLSLDFESSAFGKIQLTIQQSGTSIEVSLQTGSEQSKEQLMNQRDELAKQMRKLGFEEIRMDIHSDSKEQYDDNKNQNTQSGNEDIDNVKLAGDDQSDLLQALENARKMSA